MLLCPEKCFRSNTPLSKFSSFKTGGPSRFLTIVHSEQTLKEALRISKAYSIPVFILGFGSNLIFDDKGFDGLVIINRIQHHEIKSNNIAIAGGGFSLSSLAKLTSGQSLSGLEFAGGIPGSIGGAIVMNAGAHNRSISDVMIDTKCIDLNGEITIIPNNKAGFSYRNSIFQKNNNTVIIEAKFQLKYDITSHAMYQQYIQKRMLSQPYKAKSAGCIFKNPSGTSAGKLIDISGLKGLSIGGATVSYKHANFIINESQASSQDIVDLIHTIKTVILNKHNILLNEEVKLIPFTY